MEQFVDGKLRNIRQNNVSLRLILEKNIQKKYDTSMELREIGKTGMKVSPLSFGASSLGGVFHSLKEEEGIKAVHTAVDSGINFIDVSPYYGHLKAEMVLGKALKEIERHRYYLSTKVGRYGKHGKNYWDYSAKKAKESVFESMERLNIDFIDLINVHDIEFADLEQVCQETLPALVELRDKGIVKHVGITNLTLRHFVYVIDHVPAGTVESILSFCHYTLNDDSLVDYLDFFEQRGVGVINASPFSMGLLTERGTPDWHPAPEPLKNVAKKAAAHCKSKGECIEKLAIQYAVSNPRIATTLFSTTRPESVRQNLAWAQDPINVELLNEVREILEPRFRDTWLNS
jgi:aryl-alcohol dehydrogenase-like predicted oxidoreductase